MQTWPDAGAGASAKAFDDVAPIGRRAVVLHVGGHVGAGFNVCNACIAYVRRGASAVSNQYPRVGPAGGGQFEPVSTGVSSRPVAQSGSHSRQRSEGMTRQHPTPIVRTVEQYSSNGRGISAKENPQQLVAELGVIAGRAWDTVRGLTTLGDRSAHGNGRLRSSRMTSAEPTAFGGREVCAKKPPQPV
jgi:hypothetical protein